MHFKEFISRLVEHHAGLLKQNNSTATAAETHATLTALGLATAALDNLQLRAQSDAANYPKQLVICGPTQVGKSSVVNLLLDSQLAASSARAGFTVHCQGFYAASDSDDDLLWADRFFAGLRRVGVESLDREVPGEYSLQPVEIQSRTFANTVVWDTPDFDSVRAIHYQAPLLKTLAIADLVVFVVSREKYADKTVWEMLEFLARLNVPVCIVLNKTPVDVRPQLQESLEQKYNKAMPEREVPPVGFIGEYRKGFDGDAARAEAETLRQQVQALIDRQPLSVIETNTVGFLQHHWADWTTGLSDQHRLQQQYAALVEAVSADTLQRYRAEYIDHDRHREVIQLALSELLVLLEIPGMAKSLSKIRNVVTWPVRSLINSTKKPVLKTQDDRNQERRILDELGRHAIVSLKTAVSERATGSDQKWWDAIRGNLTDAESEYNGKYQTALDNYQTLLQVEIDRAAQSLYQNLQEQPATLNSLRAARVTTDAAAVVLAVKSGGLGAIDLILAPAMLSLTTTLTEGALGKYMQRVQKKLTDYQDGEVRSLIKRKIKRPLLSVAQHSAASSISEAQLTEVTRKLESGHV